MPDLNEAKTRALLINPQLERAGWNLSDHSQVQFEVPVKGYDPTPGMASPTSASTMTMARSWL
jgi:type I site-specific restriction endonuclease